jgi:hypothetical protein
VGLDSFTLILFAITLRGVESRCHGTRVLTCSGREVPNARVTETAKIAMKECRRRMHRLQREGRRIRCGILRPWFYAMALTLGLPLSPFQVPE